MSFEPEEGSRGLRDHVGVLRRRAPLIIAVTVVAVLTALVWSLAQPSLYRSSSQVIFLQESTSIADPQSDQLVDVKRLDPVRVIQNEVRLASSQLVRDRAFEMSGLPIVGSVTNPRDTDLLVISATAGDANDAALVANAWADAYIEVRAELTAARSTASLDAITTQLGAIDARLAELDQLTASGDDPQQLIATEAERAALVDQRGAWVAQQQVLAADLALSSANEAQIIDEAEPASSPFEPALIRNLVLALLLGVLLALVVAYAVDQLDDVIRTADDLARSLTLPVLGELGADGVDGELRALAVTDPRLEGVVGPVGGTAALASGSHVLVVPRGTRARLARQEATVLDRLGVHLVGTVLAGPAGPGAPAAPDERRMTAEHQRS